MSCSLMIIMSDHLCIGYLNVRGLSLDKWRYILDQITSVFDILFVAETWYMHTAICYAHPFYLTSSPKPDRVHTSGHLSGGLLVLVKPMVKALITSFTHHKYYISLVYAKINIIAVYLPPTISSKEIEDIFQLFSTVDILLGDINIRFGALFNDVTSGPMNKMNVFRSFQAVHNLIQLLPTAGKTRVDHAFIKCGMDVILTFFEPAISSDHPFLRIDIAGGSIQNIESSKLKRFYLKYLDDQNIITDLCTAYDACTETYELFFKDLYQEIIYFPVYDIQEAVDLSYNLLVDILTMLATTFLGTYEVSVAKQWPDRLSKIHMFKDTATLLRLFKRSQRTDSDKSFIHSRSPTYTPLQDVVQFYSSVYSPEGEDDDDSSWSYSVPILDEPGFTILNAYTIDTVKKFIQQYPKGKSCGQDSLHVCLLKALLLSTFPRHLVLLFRIFARVGLTPTAWNLSVIFPVPKTSNAIYVDAFRPISLTSMLRRCFEGILLRTLSTSVLLAPVMKFSPLQAGFRKGFSTLSHILLSNDVAHFGVKLRIFIDLKQAYDRVSIVILLKKLWTKLPCPVLLYLIHSLFTSCSSQVVVNGQLSEPFIRKFGLFQGSLLAPWLFDVYIDDLAESVAMLAQPSDSPIPPGLFFADDIQLLAKAILEAQVLIDVVVHWCHHNHMSINMKKSAFTSLISDVVLYINDEPLSQVKQYKYLGLPQTASTINWSNYVDACLQKSNKFLAALKLSTAHWPSWAKLAVYRSFLRPLMEYAAPLLWQYAKVSHSSLYIKPFFSSYQSLQDEALIWIFNKKTPLPVLHSIAALPKIADRFLGLATLFTRHIQKLDSSNPVVCLLGYCKIHCPWPDTLLTPRTISTELFSLYPDASLATLTHDKLQLFLKKLYVDQFNNSSTLASYILPTCRVHSIGVDKLIFTQSSILTLALSWRCNHFGLNTSCIVCNEFFTRAHVLDCALLDDCPLITPMLMSDFLAEKLAFYDRTNYSLPDFLLNHCQYDLFYSCMIWLQQKLH